MKHIYKTIIILTLILGMLLGLSCADGKRKHSRDGNSQTLRSVADLSGLIIGATEGSIYTRVIKEEIDAIPVTYTIIDDGVADVRAGNIAGFMTDTSIIRSLLSVPENADLAFIDIPDDVAGVPMGVASLNQDLIDRFNAFLQVIKDNGTFAEMQRHWFFSFPDLDAPIEVKNDDRDIANTIGDKDIDITAKVVVATSAGRIPFVYLDSSNQLNGYSIELMHRFATYTNIEIEFINMEFAAMIPAVIEGKVDMAIGNISITPERQKQVIFSDPVYTDNFSIAIRK